LPGLPGTAEVFDLDLHVTGVSLASDREGLACASRLQHGIGSQLAGDQHRVVGGRVTCQVTGYVVADLADLVSPAVEGPLV
jgi:hypothetical protein